MSLDSAFWVWNLVGNMFQGHHNAQLLPVLYDALQKYQHLLGNQTVATDAEFVRLYATSPAAAVEYATRFVVESGEYMTGEWLRFWMFLFSRIRDGGIVTAPATPVCQPGQTAGCTARPIPTVAEPGYDAGWYKRIVAENGAHYRVPPSPAREEEYRARQIRIQSGKRA